MGTAPYQAHTRQVVSLLTAQNVLLASDHPPNLPRLMHLTLIGHLLISPSKPSTLLSVLTILDLQPWWLFPSSPASGPQTRPVWSEAISEAVFLVCAKAMVTNANFLTSSEKCTPLYFTVHRLYQLVLYTTEKWLRKKTWKSGAFPNWGFGKTPKTYNHPMENICWKKHLSVDRFPFKGNDDVQKKRRLRQFKRMNVLVWACGAALPWLPIWHQSHHHLCRRHHQHHAHIHHWRTAKDQRINHRVQTLASFGH